MKTEHINKNMPFVEDEGYVASLVSQVTENAVSNTGDKHRQTRFTLIAASIAIAATIFGAGWIYTSNKAADDAPLDTFLSSISDQEAAMLDYYYVEDLNIDDLYFE